MLIQHTFRAINALLIEKSATKYSSNQCTKYYRNCYTFYFFVCEHFYIDFLLFLKNFKQQDQMHTIYDDCKWFF